MRQTENSVRSPWQPCNTVGWDQLQIKRKFDIELGKMLQNGLLNSLDTEVPYLKAQHVQWDRVRLDDLPTMWASPNDIKALRVHFGDLLVCEGGDVGRGAIVQAEPPDDCIIQNALHRVRGREDGDQRFLYYLLRHAATQNWFDVLCNRSTIAHFTGDKFGEMWVWLPSVNQQRAIADFLDLETTKIDALIEAKERILGILAEKRRALITHAVTQGLNPDSCMRVSFIPRLGQIPEHWELLHLKRVLAQMDYGISESVNTEGNTAVLRMGDVRDGEIDYSGVGFVNEVDPLLLLKKGDLVFNRTNSLDQIGKVGLFRGGVGFPVSFASYLVRFRCGPRVTPEFLNLLLNSAYILAWARSEALPAIGQANLNPNRYAYVPIALPPLQEQHIIVTHISAETAKLDAMRDATEKTIGLLKERRAALIAATVTGVMNISEQ